MSKEAKAGLAAAIWVIGSAAVGGFLHSLSASTWMDWIIIIFVLTWGGASLWLYRQM
jgi:hypothetical protein